MKGLIRDLSPGIQEDPPFERAVLEFQVVDVGAARPDTLEDYGLQGAETGNDIFGMRYLWTRDFGETRCERIDAGLPPLQRLDLPPDRDFTAIGGHGGCGDPGAFVLPPPSDTASDRSVRDSIAAYDHFHPSVPAVKSIKKELVVK